MYRINLQNKQQKIQLKKIRYGKLNEINVLILLLLITILGSFLRLVYLGNLSLTTDEIYIGIAAKSIIQNKIPLLPGGNLYTRGITHSYLSAFFSLIWGVNEFTTRLPSAISNIIIIILLFLVGKKIHSNLLGLIAAALFCFHPWAIEFSRWGRMYSFLALCNFLTIFFVTHYFTTKKIFYLVLSIIFTIICIFTDLWGFITPAYLIIGFYYFNYNKIKQNIKKNLLLAIIIAISTLLIINQILDIKFLQRGKMNYWNISKK